jgi:uncharacterized membrane protein YhaH (DUF805 family)
MDFSNIDFKNIDYQWLLTSFSGRIDRVLFWIGVAASVIVGAVITVVGGIIANVIPFVGWLVALALSLVALYPAAAVALKRLHDRDKPDVWLAIYFGPYLVSLLLSVLTVLLGINFGFLWSILSIASLAAFLFMLYDLGWLEGVPGPNAHGSAPVTAPRTQTA